MTFVIGHVTCHTPSMSRRPASLAAALGIIAVGVAVVPTFTLALPPLSPIPAPLHPRPADQVAKTCS